MKHWEFLLQKEGDRSWLPLDSPDVEILEGRYRIVARSSLPNTAVAVRISHLVTDATPPKRRTQTRNNRTNQDGLMVVVPFTRMEPGVWELSCASSDVLAEVAGTSWKYTVQLHVLHRDAEAEEWEPDWSPGDRAALDPPITPSEEMPPSQAEMSADPVEKTATSLPLAAPDTPERSPIPLNPEVAEILGASMDRLFQIAEQMSHQLVDEVMRDLDDDPIPVASPSQIDAAPAIHSPTHPPTHPENPIAPAPLPGMTFSLKLATEAFVASRGETLTLSGWAEPEVLPAGAPASMTAFGDRVNDLPDPWEIDPEPLDLSEAVPQTLEICLRDPQSLQLLVSDRQPFIAQSHPMPFTFTVVLPTDITTHLILGEILLCGILPTRNNTPLTLTTQAFTITLNPNELVDALEKVNQILESTDDEATDSLDLPLELSTRAAQADPSLSLDFSFLAPEATAPAPEPTTPRFPSLAGQPLPPQIYRPDPEQANQRAIALPLFIPPSPDTLTSADPSTDPGADPATETTPPDSLPTAATPEAVLDAATALAAALATDPEDETPNVSTAAPVEQTTEALAIGTDHPIDETRQADDQQATVDLPSPTQMSFQALKLQDRFLTRLNALATDAELSAWLKTNLNAGDVVMPSSPAVAPAVNDEWLTTEVVVDDERVEPQEPQRSSTQQVRRNKQPADAVPNPQPNPLLLPEDEPVPTPQLTVTTGELIAGKTVNIRVKLPNLLPRIYVKLWMNDRQTRSLIDSPRWLVDFLPNGLGELETMTQLTIPFGSLGIRFEAIAVEMQTQRESHKVSVDRAVIPPDLPAISLDDFDT